VFGKKQFSLEEQDLFQQVDERNQREYQRLGKHRGHRIVLLFQVAVFEPLALKFFFSTCYAAKAG
jgi:hypothetical protein